MCVQGRERQRAVRCVVLRCIALWCGVRGTSVFFRSFSDFSTRMQDTQSSTGGDRCVLTLANLRVNTFMLWTCLLRKRLFMTLIRYSMLLTKIYDITKLEPNQALGGGCCLSVREQLLHGCGRVLVEILLRHKLFHSFVVLVSEHGASKVRVHRCFRVVSINFDASAHTFPCQFVEFVLETRGEATDGTVTANQEDISH